MSTDARDTAAGATLTYYVIFACCWCARYLTWQVAYFDLGRFNAIAALTIAAQGDAVVWFFMHARSSRAHVAGRIWRAALAADSSRADRG